MTTEGNRFERRASYEHELRSVEGQLARRTVELEELWRHAPIADRFLAVQRILLEGEIDREQSGTLEDLNLCVQRLWTEIRALRRRTLDAQDRLRLLALEGELKRAEHSRDLFLDEQGLVEVLFSSAETFFVAYGPGELPFRDLVRRRDELLALLPKAPAAPADRTQEIPMARVYSLTGDIISAVA